MEYDTVLGQTVNPQPLDLHICNETDVFFEPVKHQTSFIPALKAFAYCIDDIDDIELWGNFDSGIASVIQVRLVACSGSDTCKPKEEID